METASPGQTTILLSSSDWEQSDYQLPSFGDNFEHYRILSMMGKGGFGAVFKVKNLNLGRDEALKLILPEAHADIEDIQRRFSREVDVVSRLEHPNIVRLYNYGQCKDGALWMSMELIKGKCLSQWMEDSRGVGFERARRITLQILAALRSAHRREIVHRDLKPANIMISNLEGYEDFVTILDFGLSKGLASTEREEVQKITTDVRKVYGSPQYMAPEQLAGSSISPSVDVYATALIMFEMLHGRPAVTGEGLFDVAYKQSYVPLVLDPKWRGSAIEAVLTKAASKQVQERYPTAEEFYDALERIHSGSEAALTAQTPQSSAHPIRANTLSAPSAQDAEQGQRALSRMTAKHVIIMGIVLVVLCIILVFIFKLVS